MIDLKAIRERSEKATRGPWYATDATDTGDALCEEDHRGADGLRQASGPFTVSRDPHMAGWDTDCGFPRYGICEHDAAFIAAAREDVPALLDLVDRLTRALVSAEWALGDPGRYPMCQECGASRSAEGDLHKVRLRHRRRSHRRRPRHPREARRCQTRRQVNR